MKDNSECVACTGQLLRIDKFKDFSCVSSDCRPLDTRSDLRICSLCCLIQRPRSFSWTTRCQEIYVTYDAYPQGSELDQKTLERKSGLLRSRSAVILDQFKKRLHPSQSGTWLDYGCGQGHLLSECARRYPNLVLIGVDESQKSREYIEHIKNATFISNIEDCDQRLDIVSMVHVLEHLESPVKILSKLKEKMKEDALLLIQIPTFVRNPFDLIIFDHGMFFTKKTISALLETAGFRVCTFARAVSQKEITVVARKSTARLNRRSVTSRDVKLTEAKLREGANYLSGLRDHAQLKASGGKVQIFGSSIGACWLFNELGTNNVACFLDEDSERVGNIFLGKEIRPFAQKNIDRTVFPLDPETKDQVIRRLQATKI